MFWSVAASVRYMKPMEERTGIGFRRRVQSAAAREGQYFHDESGEREREMVSDSTGQAGKWRGKGIRQIKTLSNIHNQTEWGRSLAVNVACNEAISLQAIFERSLFWLPFWRSFSRIPLFLFSLSKIHFYSEMHCFSSPIELIQELKREERVREESKGKYRELLTYQNTGAKTIINEQVNGR